MFLCALCVHTCTSSSGTGFVDWVLSCSFLVCRAWQQSPLSRWAISLALNTAFLRWRLRTNNSVILLEGFILPLLEWKRKVPMELFPLIASPFLTLNNFVFLSIPAVCMMASYSWPNHYDFEYKINCSVHFPAFHTKWYLLWFSFLVDATTLGIWKTSIGGTLPTETIYQWMDLLLKICLFYCTLERVQGGPYRSMDYCPYFCLLTPIPSHMTGWPVNC